MVRVVLIDLESLLHAGGDKLDASRALAALRTLEVSPGNGLRLGLLAGAEPPSAPGLAVDRVREQLQAAKLAESFEPLEVTLLLTRPGVDAADRRALEQAVRRLDAQASLGACAAVLGDKSSAGAYSAVGLNVIVLGRDCAGWQDVPLAVARLIDPANTRNLAIALAARLGADYEDVTVTRAEPDRILAVAKTWSPLPACDAIPGLVHVKLPVNVVVRLDEKGAVASVLAGVPTAEEVSEAASYAEGLFARGEVALEPGKKVSGASHVLDRDALGRRLLRRTRFSSK